MTLYREDRMFLTMTTSLTNEMWPNQYLKCIRLAITFPLGGRWREKVGIRKDRECPALGGRRPSHLNSRDNYNIE